MSNFIATLAADIDKLRTQQRFRTLEANTKPQSPSINVCGEPLRNFCSNDYLGLSNEPQIKAATIRAVEKYGVGSGAAQLLSGRSEAHEILESELAQFLNRDRALVFSSGYLANIGLINALIREGDVVHSDVLNHASLIDAIRLTKARKIKYQHSDIDELEKHLASNSSPQWIVTDALFSMDGDLADLPSLSKLTHTHGAGLIVDDAHGFGVLGNGRGTLSHFNLTQKDVPAVMVTFGKALGAHGAAVVGDNTIIETLIQRARSFIFDTALPPAIAAAASEGITLIQRQPERLARLSKNIALFREKTRSAGLSVRDSTTPIQPILIGDDQRAVTFAALLRKAGFYVRAVRPPTVPEGTARLRICLSAAHEQSDIDDLTTALAALPW